MKVYQMIKLLRCTILERIRHVSCFQRCFSDGLGSFVFVLLSRSTKKHGNGQAIPPDLIFVLLSIYFNQVPTLQDSYNNLPACLGLDRPNLKYLIRAINYIHHLNLEKSNEYLICFWSPPNSPSIVLVPSPS